MCSYPEKNPAAAPKEFIVFEVQDKMVGAKFTAEWGQDFSHLVKYEDVGKFGHILWPNPPHPVAKPAKFFGRTGRKPDPGLHLLSK